MTWIGPAHNEIATLTRMYKWQMHTWEGEGFDGDGVPVAVIIDPEIWQMLFPAAGYDLAFNKPGTILCDIDIVMKQTAKGKPRVMAIRSADGRDWVSMTTDGNGTTYIREPIEDAA